MERKGMGWRLMFRGKKQAAFENGAATKPLRRIPEMNCFPKSRSGRTRKSLPCRVSVAPLARQQPESRLSRRRIATILFAGGRSSPGFRLPSLKGRLNPRYRQRFENTPGAYCRERRSIINECVRSSSQSTLGSFI